MLTTRRSTSWQLFALRQASLPAPFAGTMARIPQSRGNYFAPLHAEERVSGDHTSQIGASIALSMLQQNLNV
jgi:hypothetical protein